MSLLLVTADDRTGALEVGGIVANEQRTIPVGPLAESDLCCVVDINSRQLSAAQAISRMTEVHSRPARFRSHKMDSGLRGNWPHEISALVELGYQVAVVASFPDAGRRCRNGVVYIQDVPVLESPFAMDPLTAPVSSKPIEVLEEAGCLGPGIVVWDADNNQDLFAAVQRCHQEGRILVGPTGAVGAFANSILPVHPPRQTEILKPLLIVCGSLNATSREQIAQLACPAQDLDQSIRLTDGCALVQTQFTNELISGQAASKMAARIAAGVSKVKDRVATLMVIGGDTAAAIVGDTTLEVLGTVDTGIPICRFHDHLLVTKGGGIGWRETVLNLVQAAV